MTDDKKPLPITREMVEELATLTEDARTHWKVSEVVSEPRERRIQELRGKVWRVEPLIALLDRIDEQEKEIERLRLKSTEALNKIHQVASDELTGRDKIIEELREEINRIRYQNVEDEIEQKAWELWAAKYENAALQPKCDEAFYAAEHFINYRNRRRREKKG